MSAADPSPDPFDVLGVSREAGDADVRRAYAARIREARAAGDADLADRIQQAFESIRDDEGRTRVRSALEGAGETAPLLAEAAHLLESGDCRGAREAYRRVLAALPRNEQALLGLSRAESRLGRLEAAAAVARKLIEVAPSDPRGWGLRAFLLLQAAASAQEAGRQQDLLQLSLRHVRRAKELGDQDAATAILESDILSMQGRDMAAFQPLLSRLAQAHELRSGELEIAVALLERAGSKGHQRTFRDTLDHLARLFPSEPERRRTVAHTLCAVARALASERPEYGIECAEFLDLSAGDDAEVQSLLGEVQSRKAQAEAHVERMVKIHAPLLAQEARRASARSWAGFFAAYRSWFVGIILVKFVLLVGVRTGCRHEPPAGNAVFDKDGKITHVIDPKGRKVPIGDLVRPRARTAKPPADPEPEDDEGPGAEEGK